ncbi:hypothetical protein JCM11641_002517 [Rhodosporidiobolus odoratus]
MIAGTKRVLPADFDDVAPPPPPALRSLPSTSNGQADDTTVAASSSTTVYDMVANAQAWAGELSERVQVAQAVQGGEGKVVLGLEEAQALLSTLHETAAGFLEKPASKADIFTLINYIGQTTSNISSGAATPSRLDRPLRLDRSRRRSRLASSARPSLAATLPFDVLCLILLQLRSLYTDQDDVGSIYAHRAGPHAFAQNLRALATVSPRWKEACLSLHRSQLHIVDVKQLPERAAELARRPHRAEALRELTIRVYDWDFAFSRSSEDAGFAIPELVERSVNLRTFAITTDRNSSYSSPALFRNRRQRFETLTGGVSLPTTILTSLPSLRTLSYGAPCTLADVVRLASEIPTLRDLDLLGDVEHTVPPLDGFRPCSPSLQRFWAPGTALRAAELEVLLGFADTATEAVRPRINSLAFTFDPEQRYSAFHPTDDEVLEEVTRLVGLFSLVGNGLDSLHLSTPSADLPDTTGGIFGGGGGGAHAWIPLGIAVMQGGVGLVPQPQPQVAAGGGGAAAGGGGAAAGGGGAGVGAAPGNAGAGAALGAVGGPPNAFGGQQIILRPLAVPDPTPFFDALVAHTPNVEHLELYGRRYDNELVSVLKKLPLSSLALSVPVETAREGVVGDLLTALKDGEWSRLRNLELSGRGGEWAPAERRQIKGAVEARGKKVVYKSTDVKG